MKISLTKKQYQGLTAIELIVVIVVIGFLAIIFFPQNRPNRKRAIRIACVNNVRQIGLAFRVWSGDQSDKFPMAVSVTNGGAMEFTTGPNLWRVMQVMSNELTIPKLLVCPADDRSYATNFTYLSNSNLSYFVGIVADASNPAMILSGDRNLTNGLAIQNGVLKLTTNDLAGWTAELHNRVGNIGLADGSVQEVSLTGLRDNISATGLETNLVQMPILGP